MIRPLDHRHIDHRHVCANGLQWLQLLWHTSKGSNPHLGVLPPCLLLPSPPQVILKVGEGEHGLPGSPSFWTSKIITSRFEPKTQSDNFIYFICYRNYTPLFYPTKGTINTVLLIDWLTQGSFSSPEGLLRTGEATWDLPNHLKVQGVSSATPLICHM